MRCLCGQSQRGRAPPTVGMRSSAPLPQRGYLPESPQPGGTPESNWMKFFPKSNTHNSQRRHAITHAASRPTGETLLWAWDPQ